jgi:DNA replication protein DnaC
MVEDVEKVEIFSNRIPVRMRQARLSGLNPAQFGSVLDYSKNLIGHVKSSGMGLLLSGPAGVGKTWSIAALTNALVSSVHPAPDHEFLTAPDLFDRFAAFSEEDGWDTLRGNSWTHTLTTVPWLVINDLGKEYRSGKLAEQIPYKLGRLLRSRSEKKLVTHVTTNLMLSGDGDTLATVYGPSIASLLSEMVKAYEVNGEDLRRRK